MTPVRKFRVHSRLSRLAVGRGGISMAEALKRATAALEEMRPQCIILIDECLLEMDARFGATAPGRGDEPLDHLYSLSSCIIDMAGALPGSGIEQAARALCDLIDLSLAAGRTGWVAVDVHLRALHLLRAHGALLPPERRQAVITGLQNVVVKRYAPPSAA
jgi:hypothetical protein